MDTGKWTQEIGVVKSMAEMAQSTSSSRPVQERKIRPQKDQIINCPRCNSTNTKFCYYNNYSLTQPRYFCKTCRRYWTEGGTLRNVPVGGGSRKNKKNPSSTIPTISTTPPNGNSTPKFPDLNPVTLPQFSSQNPKTHHDLNLGFPYMQTFHGGVPHFLELAKVENRNNGSDHQLINSSSTSFSTLELLNTGIASRELNNSFITPVSDLNGLYTSGGFPFQEMKPSSLQFSLEGVGNRYEEGSTNNGGGVQENDNVGKFVFPFGGLKQNNPSTNIEGDQGKGQGNSTGYWNGMLGGGSW